MVASESGVARQFSHLFNLPALARGDASGQRALAGPPLMHILAGAVSQHVPPKSARGAGTLGQHHQACCKQAHSELPSSVMLFMTPRQKNCIHSIDRGGSCSARMRGPDSYRRPAERAWRLQCVAPVRCSPGRPQGHDVSGFLAVWLRRFPRCRGCRWWRCACA